MSVSVMEAPIREAVPTNFYAPINPKATPEARALLTYLYSLSGKSTLSGQHNTPAHLSQYSDQAAEIAGKYPALWGQDMGFTADDMDGIIYRQAVMDEAKRQHAAGSIITLMWHTVPPTEDEPGTFKESVCGQITDEDWRELVTPGTPLHQRWTAQVDTIAAFLAQLRDARIPILWRPYHEMNGGWFWWGKRSGPNGYALLWKQMYDRLVNVHELHNLLWVWNPNAPSSHLLPYPDCFPGIEWVDALATDVYRNNYLQSHHDDLVELAQGKPVALGEVGQLPTPEILEQQPEWAWFMVWTGHITSENTPEAVKEIYDSPRVLARPARSSQ